MALPFLELLEIAKECVPMRAVYDHLGLKYFRSDGETQCKCPFHGKDNNPSSRIYDETNSWYCFTCGFSKTPFTFYKKIKEQNVTDALADFLKEFRPEILESRAELSVEDFSKEAIMRAYLTHQRESVGLDSELVSRFYLPGRDMPPPSVVPAGKAIDTREIYRLTRHHWVSSYGAPNFFTQYCEFTSRLNRLSKSPTETDCSEFNQFMNALPNKLKSS